MDSVEGRSVFWWKRGKRWPSGPVAGGDWAAPASCSTRTVTDPCRSPTKDFLGDHRLKKPYRGALASVVLAVWDLPDPCLPAKDCYPSGKCSRLISIESSWLKGKASGLVLGAKWWWLILLQQYQRGSSMSYHATTGLGNASQLPSRRSLTWSAGV